MKELQQSVKELERSNKALAVKYESAQKDLHMVEGKMEKLPYNKAKAAEVQAQHDVEHKIVVQLRERMEALSDMLTHLQFAYKDPSPNFNRKMVRPV